MASDYAVLAPVYDAIGYADYARRITPRLMDYAQRIDWLGRRIVVLGCGTGGSIEYLSQYPYNITGVDQSPEMLDIARRKLDTPGVSLKWLQQDIRENGGQITTADLVLALNVINDLNSLRDLEAVFVNAQHILDSGKLFIFDMMTVQGLAEHGSGRFEMVHDDPAQLTVFAKHDFDYERQTLTTNTIVFQRHDNGWERKDARGVLRGFPVQAVATLLQRNGFQTRAILNTQFETYDPATSRADRVIFVAEKQQARS